MQSTIVFLITETGRIFNDEGIDYLRKTLYRDYGLDEELMFVMGGILNNPVNYLTGLKANPESYTVLSKKDMIFTIDKSENQILIDNFQSYVDAKTTQTTWEIFSENM